jgi:N-methylhydantoinase A
MSEGRGLAIGIDIGGTFTDLVAITGNGDVHTCKLLTNPADHLDPIQKGLATLLADTNAAGADVETLIHGTTIATNAILERRGARCALLTTRGFRDVLEFRRLRVPSLYGTGWRKPPPLVSRRYRRELDERVAANGEVIRPLDPDEVRRIVRELVETGIESIAVCLINAYANPVHERAIGALLRSEFPDLPLSISTDILPEIQEYERTSTTVVNAYVMPLLRRYLTHISGGLGAIGVQAPMLIMQSNGGLLTVPETMARPVHIVESGPAAGLMAAARLARFLDEERLIAFDMGGTTAKASLVEGGEPTLASEFEVGGTASSARRLAGGDGYVIRSAVLDLIEIGQGGGSIAWLDSAHGLHVGPQSASSDPGPCCYGRGGTMPTVTDANVVLGYLNPRYLLGGGLQISRERAELAISRVVAEPLRLDVIEAAWGIHLIATASMTRGVKAVSTERGRDPRDFTLLAYGGGGPLHAVGIAAALGIQRVVVPPAPGVFSAVGLLFSSIEVHETQTCLGALDQVDLERVDAIRAALRAKAATRLAAAGFESQEIVFRELADLRYMGQTYELTIPLAAHPLTREGVPALEQTLGEHHMRAYGHRGRQRALELVTLRVIARGARETASDWLVRPPVRHRAAAPIGVRKAYFGPTWGMIDAVTLERSQLEDVSPGGPLIVEEYDATTVVPPGWTVSLNPSGAMVITSDDAKA